VVAEDIKLINAIKKKPKLYKGIIKKDALRTSQESARHT
jgi:hypothetical protein